jgi:hypothetical protein
MSFVCKHGTQGLCNACAEEASKIVHGELHDDGSYHCKLSYPNDPLPVECSAVEWSRSEFVAHLREAHRLNVSERPESGDVVIDGEPAPIVHRGVLHDRVEGEKCNYHGCLREKAFADAWEQAQRDDHILAALSSITVPKGTPGAWRPVHLALANEYRARSWSSEDDDELYTQRDATVAATVVQWLGTNVGFCWLDETLKKAGYTTLHTSAFDELRTQAAKSTQSEIDRLTQLADANAETARQLSTEHDAWRRRAQLIDQALISQQGTLGAIALVVDSRLREISLSALRYAAAHCSSEAELFERFVEAQIKEKTRARERFSLSTTEAGNTLRAIANEIRDATGAIIELREIMQGARARIAEAASWVQPDSAIEPAASSQTPSASS